MATELRVFVLVTSDCECSTQVTRSLTLGLLLLTVNAASVLVWSVIGHCHLPVHLHIVRLSSMKWVRRKNCKGALDWFSAKNFSCGVLFWASCTHAVWFLQSPASSVCHFALVIAV